jgi:transcriptional regulator with XRE-family HTH domain
MPWHPKKGPRLVGRTPLRIWRERTGVSLAELGRRAGVQPRTVRNVAAGAPASGETAVALSAHTGIDVATLVRGSK